MGDPYGVPLIDPSSATCDEAGSRTRMGFYSISKINRPIERGGVGYSGCTVFWFSSFRRMLPGCVTLMVGSERY